MAPPDRDFVSWAGGAAGSGPPDRERRQHFHLESVLLGIAVIVFDIVVLVVAAGVAVGANAIRNGLPCTTYWSDRARLASTGSWAVVALVVGAVLIAALLRRHVVAVLVAQLLLAAVLLPLTLSLHAHAAHYAALLRSGVPYSAIAPADTSCDPSR